MGSLPLRHRTAAAALALTLGGVPVAVAAASATSGPAVDAQGTEPTHMHLMPVSASAYEFGETLSKLSGRELEVTFMASIIEHHQGAIDMAKLELERGESPDIQTHAENIIASQTHQVEQFTRWLAEWYDLTPEEALAEMPAEAKQELAASEEEMQQMMPELEAAPAGPQFDVMFVHMMIPHHQAGIIEFLEPQSRADHPQLRVAASNGILTQQAEVTDFRTWLSGHQPEGHGE